MIIRRTTGMFPDFSVSRISLSLLISTKNSYRNDINWLYGCPAWLAIIFRLAGHTVLFHKASATCHEMDVTF